MKTSFGIAVCALLAVPLVASLDASAARFVPLGFFPGEGDVVSYGEGISADGMTVAGTSNDKPFRWTEAEGLVHLGDFPWVPGGVHVKGISGDGNVIFGDTSGKNFHWTQAAGYQEIFPGLNVSLSGIAYDGSAYSYHPDTDISKDGLITVGRAIHLLGLEAYRDSPNTFGGTTRQWLGELPGGEYQSIPLAVSGDGRVAVGQSNSPYDDGMGTIYDIDRPFHWSEEHGMIVMEPWPSGTAVDVSSIGMVAIGYGGNPGSGGATESFRWTPATGAISIHELLLAEGIDIAAMGWTEMFARGVSANGRVIVGSGHNPSGQVEAWLAELPVPGDFDEDGDSDGNDFLKWQRGESHDPMSPSDFNDWQANWEFFSPESEASANAVPEPGALFLGILCLAVVLGVWPQKKMDCMTKW
jgi:uncharacterized membrane protein